MANQNIGFVNVILLAQLMLFFSKMSIEVIRTWIFLSISTRVNIYIVSDFLNKLMRLKMSFFENRLIGDLIQRIGDHSRIQTFISSSTFGALFSLVSLVIYSIVLAWYNLTILVVFFFVGSSLYFGWITIFLYKRKELDYKSFARNSRNQSLLIQIITGIKDIKLNNAEKEKRWDWEDLQAETYQISIAQVRVNQIQSIGSQVIDQVKNIIISYLSAKAVINGEMTLGMMLAVQYMIGQLSSPIGQILALSNSYQDAKISLERLTEIHSQEDELVEAKIYEIQTAMDIEFKNVNFTYADSSHATLSNLNFKISEGKITSIVGASGSGKTTIIKLLLKF
ncbi:ABC transporter transmembrane domain-containing protein [Pedobacter sp. NJ-S-72]